MRTLRSNQALVARDLVLDGRLALFHRRAKWLAIADLHFGYELSQRAAGRLMPMWGMATIEERLIALLQEYAPDRLIIVGDLVHDRTASRPARDLVGKAADRCDVVVVAGNHDREIARDVAMRPSLTIGRFQFHHGHCAVTAAAANCVQIIGHHHPAGVLRDGAGLRLKCPAFVQEERCWILPAFSPWSAGTNWRSEEGRRVWLCTPERVLPLPEREPAIRARSSRARTCNADSASP